MGRSRSPRGAILAAVAAIVALVVVPAIVLAHPLGDFTINHYVGVRVEPERILVDLVVDQAEVPTFQARRALDLDADGVVSDAEAGAARVRTCEALLRDVRLSIAGALRPWRLTDAGLSFPAGAGGLPTMRSICVAETPLEAALWSDGSGPIPIAVRDDAFAERLGWREIVVVGSGVTVSASEVGGPLRSSSVSARLTAYPEDRLAAPLTERAIEFLATAGGPTLPAWSIPDASPVMAGAATPQPAAERPARGDPLPAAGEGELPAIFRTRDLSPVVLLLSLATAAALGAGHALTPGHGKTLMAAYLVGTRGSIRHAVGLGLSVSLSHTVGILVLAAVVLGAADVLPPDVVVRAAPVLAALSIVAIGGWMLLGEWRRRREARAHQRAHVDAHAHGLDHEHDPHPHADPRRLGDPMEHRHGGVRHSHAPARGATVTWRSLFALGLAGGLIPSTSALLILLGAIAAGRPAFGLVLVVAFGVGMAAVMGGIGVLLVAARGRLERRPLRALDRAGAVVPLVAAVVVFGFGVWLTVGAVGAIGGLPG